MSTAIPVQEGLFSWPATRPQLIGSRCLDCGEAAFPAQAGCRACCGTRTERVELGDHGTLWTWTVQRFMPKTPYHTDETPASFQPFGVGYVEMPGGVRVESRLLENDPAKLRIGMPMQLEIVPLRHDETGNAVVNFAFRPA